jgi:hypothetical protein
MYSYNYAVFRPANFFIYTPAKVISILFLFSIGILLTKYPQILDNFFVGYSEFQKIHLPFRYSLSRLIRTNSDGTRGQGLWVFRLLGIMFIFFGVLSLFF